MGEVRANTLIFNATDDTLARRGKISQKEIRCYKANALIDTGAIRSVIPEFVLEQLGLEIRGKRVAEYADGRKETVGVSEPIIINIMGRDTLEEALILGDEVLIGQTVLEKLDLLVDCANNKLIPNPAHPDQPVSKVK